jgi:hypothetical protein
MINMHQDADLELARRWRSRAEEYRAFAAGNISPGTKESMMRTSATYDGLADRAEERAAGDRRAKSD